MSRGKRQSGNKRQVSDDPQPLAALLQRYARERGLKPAALARRSGLAKMTVQHWLVGDVGQTYGPSKLKLMLLAAALGLNRARTERLLRVAGQPPLDTLLGAATEEERDLVATWMAAAPNNLPSPPSSFIGRDEEVLDLAEELSGRDVRLVTLTGPGGSGKTRLALEVARLLLDSFPDGVWFVPLGSVDDPALVLPTLAQTLRVWDSSGEPLEEQLAAWLRARRTLLLLDNFEQLLDAAPAVAALLAAAPGLKVLVTSRVQLHLTGEHERPVAPLPLPSPGARGAALRDNPAIRLFAARAWAASRGFRLNEATAPAVAKLCARLDGLPLAIELAAARVRQYAPRELLERFPRALEIGVDGPRDAPARQRTLRATIEWSYDLLDEPERAVLRRLAVFAGGCTPGAAAAICHGPGVAGDEVAPLLASLADKSLAIGEDGPAPPEGAATPRRRYRLLETIREYGREQLEGHGEAEEIARRHCEWCIALCESVPAPLEGGPEAAAWLARLDAEAANVRAALGWALDQDPAAGLRLAGAAWPFWFARQGHAEGREWLRRLLDRVPAEPAATTWRARGLYGLGYLELWHDAAAARRRLEEALALAAALGDDELAMAIRWPLAFACLSTGVIAEAERHLAAGWEPAERSNRPGVRGVYRMLRGYLALQRGALGEAEAELTHALADTVAAEQPLFQCMVRARLGEVHLRCGLPERAAEQYFALQATADALGSLFYRLVAQVRLGAVQEWSGELDAAEATYTDCLALAARAGGGHWEQAKGLMGLGRLALYRGRYDQAILQLQESATLVEQMRLQPLWSELAYPLGLALWHAGDRAAAATQLTRALDLRWQGGDRLGLAQHLEGLAALAVEAGQARSAAEWLGAAERLREQLGSPRPSVEQPRHAETRARAEAELGAAAFADARLAGRETPLDEVVARARDWLAAPAPAVGRRGGARRSGRDLGAAGVVRRPRTARG